MNNSELNLPGGENPGRIPDDIYGNIVRSQLEADPSRIEDITTPEDVERVAFEILDTMPEGQDTMDRINKAREKGEEDVPAIKERGRLWRQVCIEVSLVTGVEIEAAEHEAQREAYRTRLNEVLSTIPAGASDEEVMLKMGMIRPVQGSKGHVFTFPSRFIPPYIREQWNTYTSMIEQFEDASHKLKGGIISQNEFNAIDSIRRSAHNNLSNSIGEIFQFPDWDLEAYRHLIAKMADEKFAEPTGEMRVYAELLRGKALPPEHLTHLHKGILKHSHDPKNH